MYDKNSKSIVNIFKGINKIKFDDLEDNNKEIFTEKFSGNFQFFENEFNIDINSI